MAKMTGFLSGQSTFAGITNTFSYNTRLQAINMSASAPSQTVFSIGYDFHLGNGNNGDVFGITNFKDNTRNQTFTYDPLNRLISAQNSGTDCAVAVLGGKKKFWGNNYAYDAWGNLLQKNVTKCSAENLNVTVGVNNRISTGGYTYDPAGNMTVNATDGVTATYDAESRIDTALKSGVTTTYVYDSDGNRAKKTNGSNDTLYWYMTPGIIAESDLSGVIKSEYVFFAGERVARRDYPSGSIAYYFSDHLKTASVITDSLGNIKSESDFYPWGGELQLTNNDSNHYKFTGKERDSETGLDYFGARYYSSGLGRWVSADWSATPVPVPYADLSDPQTLNLNTYVRNIPTTRFDVDGHQADRSYWQRIKAALSSFFSSPPPPPTPTNGVPGMLSPRSCDCPPQNEQDNKKENNNNSKSDNNQNSSGKKASSGQNTSSNGTRKAGTSGGPRAGKPFTRKDKKEIKAENAAAHNGQTTCEECGQPTVPAQQSKAGVTPPGNETHVDHVIPASKLGDGSKSNAEVLCRDCNLRKSDTTPP